MDGAVSSVMPSKAVDSGNEVPKTHAPSTVEDAAELHLAVGARVASMNAAQAPAFATASKWRIQELEPNSWLTMPNCGHSDDGDRNG